MNSFKSFAVSTLAAASTLVAVALSAPAQACTGCTIKLNGPVLQGISLQGITLQGISLQGPVFQGPVIQGPIMQGPVVSGAHGGQYIAVTLPSGETIPVR